MILNLALLVVLGQSPQCANERAKLHKSMSIESRLAIEVACDTVCAREALGAVNWKIRAARPDATDLHRNIAEKAKVAEIKACVGSRKEAMPLPDVVRLLEWTLRGQWFVVGAMCAIHQDGYKVGHLWLDGVDRWRCIWAESEWDKLRMSDYGRAMMGKHERPR